MVRLLSSPRALRSFSLGLFVLGWAPIALAQSTPASDAQAPAHISYVDGAVLLERDGTTDDSPGSMPLLAGDRVRTRSGRVEILFADGSTLHLDNNSAIDLQSDELVRLVEGRVRLSIPGPSREVSYRIDAPNGWAHITEPGDYRVGLMQSAGGSELELAVIRGRAELANEGGQTPLRAGERAFVRAGVAPSEAYVANSAALDAFDRWSEARRDQRMTASAEYLPEEVRPYASSFEQYGYWRDEPAYGRVWYPRVAVDWRPYYRGRWVSLRPYGWTWVAYDPWGWPTHHYGRWGVSAVGSWFWIPGRTWGAAWVSWGYAPGYVSWCPLGWNNRPVFQINVINGHSGWDRWRGWTVIPQHRFGHGYVHNYTVRASHIDHRTLNAFAYRDRAPEIVGRAVPRASAPISLAGTGSRRGSGPLYTNLPADQGRMRTDGARIRVPDGARPISPDRSAAGSGERAVPSRPAVRADRAVPLDAPGATSARPADRRGESPAASRDPGMPGARRRAESPRGAVQESVRPDGGARRAVPRSESVPDQRPSSVSPDPAAPSSRRRVEAPAYGRPSAIEPPRSPGVEQRLGGIQPERRDYGTRPAPTYDARPRAAPRAEPSRPSGEVRAPQGERRGPDRSPSGSIQRGPSPSARPSGGSGGGTPSARPGGGAPQSSAPSAGARPRGGRGGH